MPGHRVRCLSFSQELLRLRRPGIGLRKRLFFGGVAGWGGGGGGNVPLFYNCMNLCTKRRAKERYLHDKKSAKHLRSWAP